MKTCPRPSGVRGITRPFSFSEVSRLLQGGEVVDRVHPRNATAEARPPSARRGAEALDHHERLDLAHSQPLVEIVPILLHTAGAFHKGHRAELPQAVERFLHLIRLELQHRRAVALLVAAGDQRIKRHGVGVGRGLGLFAERAQHAAIDGIERPPARRGLSGMWRCFVHAVNVRGGRGEVKRQCGKCRLPNVERMTKAK